jgi:CubicO group peptidase (beta-lactamase class C family)
MANIPFLSQASLNSGNTEASLRLAGLSWHLGDGLCVVVLHIRDLRWYALRQSAGSSHVEAVTAHRGMDEQYNAFREGDGWSVEHGTDLNDYNPTVTPTTRMQLLLKWFAENQH